MTILKILKNKILWIGVLIILTFFLVWSFLIEPNRLVVNTYPIRIRDWSPKLNKFRIALLSDIHGGSSFIDEEKLKKIVEVTNSQEPEVILLLGDYVSHQTFDKQKLRMDVNTVFENLRGLKAKLGVFAVMGNQDNELGNQIIRDKLQEIGYKVLEIEAAQVERNGENLYFVGLPDALFPMKKTHAAAVRDELSKIGKQSGKVILFAHHPDIIWTISQGNKPLDDVILFIAGHTHGGQCNFPIIGRPFVPTNYGQKFAQGHVHEYDMDFFISSGIGTSKIPARFNVPPEVSILEIFTDE